MSKHKKLEDFKKEIEQCVKCGACQAHCPVYGEEAKESVVARGKVALAQALLDKDAELDDRIIEDMSKCLLCGSCFDKCPNLVPTDEIVMATRREIAERKGLTFFGKGVSAVLKNPPLMDLLAKGGSKFSKLIFKKVPEGSGLRLRFPAPFVTMDRTIPEIAETPFRDRHPEFIQGETDKPTVAFFTGCSINYMYPEIGEAFLKILRFMGYNILIPKGQGCCGLPTLSSGDGAAAQKLADENLRAFGSNKIDHVVTACASCNIGLGKHTRELSAAHEETFANVTDILQFLVKEGLVDKLKSLPQKEKTKVTYHDPCHLRTQGITKEPRLLLEALPGVDFVNMEGADRCCGLGGTYSVYHYDTSKKIGAKKSVGIEKSQAELVASACPGCMMQLQDTINHAGLPQKTVHVLELIARELPKQ